MSSRPIQIAAQYLLGLLLVVFFVALLTFIFSFLGTIFCAALTGMMLGAYRNLRWQAFVASFLFPAISVAALRLLKTDLPGSQTLVVALVCFGVFWLTYLLAAALFVYERSNRASPVCGANVVAAVSGTGSRGSSLTEPKDRLTIGCLQGEWSCEFGDGQDLQEKVISIQEEKLTLRVADSEGRVCVLAKARVRLDELKPLQTLVIFENAEGGSSDTLVCI